MSDPAPDRALPRQAVTLRATWPSVRAGLWAVALFAAALLLVRAWQEPLRQLLDAHAGIGIALFVATSAVAVLLPMLTNLPLVPLAALAWGPAWTATLLLAGWLIGAALAFALGRHARQPIVKRFPSVVRHARIDRLIHPRHRLLSLVLLRMTFPVDVLSYALGLFSPRTTALQNLLSTAIGAAPFAVLFALVPTLSPIAQSWLLAASVVGFVGYAGWVLHAERSRGDG